MNRKRRAFLKISAAGAVVAAGGGALLAFTREKGLLNNHMEGTRDALEARFGSGRASMLVDRIRVEYKRLAPGMPYIGGAKNPFTEWLIYGVYYLAVYRILRAEGESLEAAGKAIYDTFQAMADVPKWLLRLVGRFKYDEAYLERLQRAASESRRQRYPGDWVASFIEGDGIRFDYGIDITECGICKYYRAQGAPELTPYLCLSDAVVSEAFDRGLVRHKTLAEGKAVCDFRYKKGRPTYVAPLRNGWPPRFLNA